MFPSAVMLDLDLELEFWEPPTVSTPLGKFSGFFGLGVCYGVEQGARIGLSEISFSGISRHLAPNVEELFFVSRLVPLSAFSEIFDSSSIFDVFGYMHFFDIIISEIGGGGLGSESVVSSNSIQSLESLTPGVGLSTLCDSTAISWDPYIT